MVYALNSITEHVVQILAFPVAYMVKTLIFQNAKLMHFLKLAAENYFLKLMADNYFVNQFSMSERTNLARLQNLWTDLYFFWISRIIGNYRRLIRQSIFIFSFVRFKNVLLQFIFQFEILLILNRLFWKNSR